MPNSDFIFCVLGAKQAFGTTEYGKSCILVVNKEYWDVKHCLKDSHISRELSDDIRKMMGEEQESVFSSRFHWRTIKTKLIAVGLIYSEALQDKMGDAYFY